MIWHNSFVTRPPPASKTAVDEQQSSVLGILKGSANEEYLGEQIELKKIYKKIIACSLCRLSSLCEVRVVRKFPEGKLSTIS